MRLLWLKFILVVFIANLTLLLSNSLALAAVVRCEAVHLTEEDQRSHAFQALAKLTNANIDLVNRSLKSGKLTAEDIKAFEIVVEDYLRSAQISFEKTVFVAYDLEISGKKLGVLTSHRYLLESVEDGGDLNTDLIRGFLAHKEMPVPLILDPLFSFQHENSMALFDLRRRQIVFSVNSLSDRVFGKSDPLRHEMKHAFENEKLLNGQHTLSRFHFLGRTSADDPYAGLLAMDELETHLLDLRTTYAIGEQRQARLDNMNLTPEFLKSISDSRQRAKAEGIEFLLSTAQSSLQALDQIEIQLTKSHPDGGGWVDRSMAVLNFSHMKNPNYSQMNILISSSHETTKPEDLMLQALDEVHWAKARVLEIQRQVQALRTKN